MSVTVIVSRKGSKTYSIGDSESTSGLSSSDDECRNSPESSDEPDYNSDEDDTNIWDDNPPDGSNRRGEGDKRSSGVRLTTTKTGNEANKGKDEAQAKQPGKQKATMKPPKPAVRPKK
ncbi:hypothetical protein MD484_g7192, partial [Candolleomyces efflorescens]